MDAKVAVQPRLLSTLYALSDPSTRPLPAPTLASPPCLPLPIARPEGSRAAPTKGSLAYNMSTSLVGCDAPSLHWSSAPPHTQGGSLRVVRARWEPNDNASALLHKWIMFNVCICWCGPLYFILSLTTKPISLIAIVICISTYSMYRKTTTVRSLFVLI